MTTARTLIPPLLTWCVLYGAYPLLVVQVPTDELVGGAAVTDVATTLSVAARSGSACQFNLQSSTWIRPAAQPLAVVPREVGW